MNNSWTDHLGCCRKKQKGSSSKPNLERKSRQLGAKDEDSYKWLQVLCDSILKFEMRYAALPNAYTDPDKERKSTPETRSPGQVVSIVFATRFSLDGILASRPAEIVEICLELGIMRDGQFNACEWSETTIGRIESKKDHASYRCKAKDCGCSKLFTRTTWISSAISLRFVL